MNQAFNRTAAIAAALAFFVIVLGAFVRLSDAGLGCPDWPGCYGQLTWPDAQAEVVTANEAFPERPVETDKAWKEMVHRYLAGFLVLFVVALNWLAWRGGQGASPFRKLSGVLFALIIFQAALGMWTVTLKLLPVIVMAHLMGGMATLGLLVWLWMSSRGPDSVDGKLIPQKLGLMIKVALAVLVVQIALGGWTTANYSAIVCPDLPTCQGELWPETNFREGFVLWREIGVDYEGGVLDLPSRTAIHMSHRLGAIVTLALLLYAGFRLSRERGVQRDGIVLMALVSVQFILGLLNILLRLPLGNAVAHNGVAALLLALLVSFAYRSKPVN